MNDKTDRDIHNQDRRHNIYRGTGARDTRSKEKESVSGFGGRPVVRRGLAEEEADHEVVCVCLCCGGGVVWGG